MTIPAALHHVCDTLVTTVGRKFTRIWIFGSVSAVPTCVHQAISVTVKLQDTLSSVLAYFATWKHGVIRLTGLFSIACMLQIDVTL